MKTTTKYFLAFLLSLLLTEGAFSQVTTSTVNLTSSKLPICIIKTPVAAIADEPKTVGTMKIIYNGPGKINNVTDKKFIYHNGIGIERRGNSSQYFEQLQYGLETRDSITGANLNDSLLGMPGDNDWVLYAPWNDISMLRNIMAYHLWDKMDHWAPRTRLCELIVNGTYQGVYVLMESIKQGKKRVETANLKYEDTTGLGITGGYIVKIDASNNTADKKWISKVPGVKVGTGGFPSQGNPLDVTWLLHYPKSKDVHPKQLDYIQKYVDTVEAVIQSANFANPITGYNKYISLPSFVDYFIHTELSKNGDGFKRSAYFYKEKLGVDGSKGQLKAGPVWDYNLAFGNVNFCGGNKTTGWVYQGCETLPVPALWTRLLQDPNFTNAVKCRYQELRKTILSEQYLNGFLDKYVNDSLREAQVRQYTMYDDLFLPASGSAPTGTGASFMRQFAGYRVASYNAEIDTLKKWLKTRLTWLDNNLPGTCLTTTATYEEQMADAVNLYPNPSNGSFVLDAPLPITNVELYDSYGKKLQSLPSIPAGNNISVDALQQNPDGMYTVKFQMNGATIYKKIVKIQ